MVPCNFIYSVFTDVMCVRDTEALILSACAFSIHTPNHWTVFQVQPLHCGGHTSRRRKDLRSGTAQRPVEAPAGCRGGALNLNNCVVLGLGITMDNNPSCWTSPSRLSISTQIRKLQAFKGDPDKLTLVDSFMHLLIQVPRWVDFNGRCEVPVNGKCQSPSRGSQFKKKMFGLFRASLWVKLAHDTSLIDTWICSEFNENTSCVLQHNKLSKKNMSTKLHKHHALPSI